MQAALVEENWPLIIPPLLTIIDDESTTYKIKGCELMTILLKNTPSSTLSRTGLGEVFEDAVLPYLAYLPTVTPEDESLQLLGAAYPALISLVRTMFSGRNVINSRRKHLDKIVRQGILKGYYHAREHVKIMELLVGQITVLVDEMGVWAVKHLKVCIRGMCVDL
jgi:tRNA nucleotidyltransferase (CCA-adding enzyme)